MNLNYDKIKQQHEHGGNTWTSYSDLFLVLSVVFLLLFTVANIRSGTMSVAQQTQLVQAKAELDDLKKQIKAYDVLKEDYVKNGASQDELSNYHELMDKMELLSSDAKKERDELAQQSKAADDKFKGLNKYQALVKNIINANLVASGKMKHRDLVIGEKENDIQGLTTTVDSQQNQIAKNEKQIDQIQTNLEKQIAETRYAYRSKKNSKEKMEAAIQKLTAQSQSKIDALKQETQQTVAQLDQTKSKLAEKSKEAQNLVATMNQKEINYQASIAHLNQTHEQQAIEEKAAFERSMNELKLTGEAKLAQERAYAQGQEEKNRQYQEKLAGLNKDLQATRNGISEIESKYKGSIKNLQNTLSAKDAQYQASVAGLQRDHEAQMAREKGEFEKRMTAMKLSGEAKIAQEKAYADEQARKNAEYQGKLAGLSKDLEATKAGMGNLQGAVKNLQQANQGLQASNQGLAGDLAASQRKLNEQRVLAESIKSNFAKAGIEAAVDGKTGDVVINFKGEYFDTGKAELKSGMKSILEKTFPIYAKSLMENKAIADKIGSVEIVGFASPTYKGKSVDPSSLSSESREAVNYNMDLSYQRAKSIFEHVFDTDHMQFAHQKTLLPLIKVSGRSYLAVDKQPGRSTAALSQGADYCSVFDCKKAQRVIIKFNLREE